MIKIKPEVGAQTLCSATFVWFLWSSSNTFRSLVRRMIKPCAELLLVEDQSHKNEADPSKILHNSEFVKMTQSFAEVPL